MNTEILGYVFFTALMSALIGSAAWAYGDAKKRSKPPLVVALLVAFGAWPTGLIAWLIFRPALGRPTKRFNLEDYRQQ